MNASSYIVKATYGAETRKWKSNSHGKQSELVNEVLNEFGIEAEKIHLKYKDSDGDLVELLSNEDLELAVELEKALNIVVITDSDDFSKSLNEFRSSLSSLIADATSLVGSLDNLHLHDKKSNLAHTRDVNSSSVKSNLAHTRDVTSSSVKSEPIVDPATLEEVQLDETIQEKKPPTYNEFQVKNAQFVGQNGYSSYQHPSPFNRSQQMGSSPLPPAGNYGQQQVPQSNHAQPLSSTFPPNNYGQQPFQPPSGYSQPLMGNYGQQQVPQMNHAQQPNQTLPLGNYGQQQFQQPSSNLPSAQSNSYGQPQQQQFQPPVQPPAYAPVKLTPGWNAPPSTFFK